MLICEVCEWESGCCHKKPDFSDWKLTRDGGID